MENITLKDSLGNPVEAILSIPEQAKAVVILSHGFTSSKKSTLYIELEGLLNKAGLGTVRYDYFGHGPAYGHTKGYDVSADTTLSKTVESLKAVINLVRSRGEYNIGLLGSSFGGLVSLVAAAQDPDIKALVLKSSVTEPKQFWRARLGDEGINKWEREGVVRPTQDIVDYDLNLEYWQDLRNYDTLEMAKNISCPVLIIHGEKDICVPMKQSQDLAKALNTEVKVIEGADHSYSGPGQQEKVTSMMLDFLVEKLS